MKKAIVLGAGGFIGAHLVKKLKSLDYYVTGIDLKYPEYSASWADNFIIGDLREQELCREVITDYDELYQLAADMGGAGYIFTGTHDVNIMCNSALINLNVVSQLMKNKISKVFFSSSACIYPEYNQIDPNNPVCSEDSAYPAAPDSEYGWEKIFSERLYMALHRNYGVDVKIARYHNIFGPEGSWQGGKEKAPAAVCRKVIQAHNGSNIEIWGDGDQTRSFLYIDECIDATLQLMNSDFCGPVNIGSEEMITINQLANIAISLSGKSLGIKHISGPTGVRGRTSDNKLIKEKLNWNYSMAVTDGITKLYKWIAAQQ